MKNHSAKKGGKSSRGKVNRKHKKTEKNHNKWFQRGCQNEQNQTKCKNSQTGGGVSEGGGGLMGGAAWAPSNIYPIGSADPQQNAIITDAEATGTHYSLNNQLTQPPQSSNALVEMANNITGGGRGGSRRKSRPNNRKQKKSQRHYKKMHRGRKGIKLACQKQQNNQQQHGGSGYAAYLPMNVSNAVRSMGDSVGGFIHNMQGGLTPYNYSDPTHQPIGNTTQLV